MNMDINMNKQFQEIKTLYKKSGTQFENIEMQINNNNNQKNNQNLSQNLISSGLDIINVGINTLFMGMQIPDMNRNNNNILNQIYYLINKIQNISKTIANINYQNPYKNMGGFNSNNNLGNNNQINRSKINVHFFNRFNGEKNNIVVDYGTTIDEILKQYIIKVNLPQLINNNNNFFLSNGNELNFGDNRKVDVVFKANSHPDIEVIIKDQIK